MPYKARWRKESNCIPVLILCTNKLCHHVHEELKDGENDLRGRGYLSLPRGSTSSASIIRHLNAGKSFGFVLLRLLLPVGLGRTESSALRWSGCCSIAIVDVLQHLTLLPSAYPRPEEERGFLALTGSPPRQPHNQFLSPLQETLSFFCLFLTC